MIAISVVAEQTIPAVLRAAATRFGDHPAYVEGGETLSYADLLERVRRTAAGFRERGQIGRAHV